MRYSSSVFIDILDLLNGYKDGYPRGYLDKSCVIIPNQQSAINMDIGENANVPFSIISGDLDGGIRWWSYPLPEWWSGVMLCRNIVAILSLMVILIQYLFSVRAEIIFIENSVKIWGVHRLSG